jgi:hypothetical protein
VNWNDVGYLTDREIEVIRRALATLSEGGMYHQRLGFTSNIIEMYPSDSERATARELDVRFMGARRVA